MDLSTVLTLDLLREILTREKIIEAPNKREFYEPHKEAVIGIGYDHSCSITIDEESYNELFKMPVRCRKHRLKSYTKLTIRQMYNSDGYPHGFAVKSQLSEATYCENTADLFNHLSACME